MSEIPSVPDQEHVEWLPLKTFAAQNPGVSVWLIGELVRRNELPHVRLGRRVLIPEDAFSVMAARQSAEREVSGDVR